MIDFSGLPIRNKTYAGANGSKLSVVYDGKLYMLKFPSTPSRNKEMSYTNGCVSEYIGCHVFESIGIPVQETLLGTYTKNGKKKVVVACRDFVGDGLVLQDFASLKNTIIDSEHNGYGTELSDILRTLDEQTAIEPHTLIERFWDMFIVDALIGNWDRHNGNWGFLYDSSDDTISLAPVFDCGSCLFPQADEEIMKKVLDNPAELEFRVYDIPLSGIRIDGQKIRYFDFISSLQNRDCNEALERITPRIDMKQIDTIIEDTPFITELQKAFYKTIIAERKERILDYAFEKLLELQNKKMLGMSVEKEAQPPRIKKKKSRDMER